MATGSYEALNVNPVALDHANCPDQTLVALAKSAWDEALSLGRKARLPQRPDHRHRPHRHHRSGDGLRHHRDRAGLRAGEIQETGRRRLFQDHQPVGAGGPWKPWATPAIRSPRSSPMRSATARIGTGPGDQPHRADRPWLWPAPRSRRSRQPCRSAFDIRFVFNQWTLGEDFCKGTLGIPAEKLNDPTFDLLRHLGFTKAADRRRQRPCLRHDDAGRRAVPENRALPGLRLRQPLRQDRQALSVGRQPHLHDGGGAVASSRARSPRRSTCPTRPRIGETLAAYELSHSRWASRPTRSTATAPSSASRWPRR